MGGEDIAQTYEIESIETTLPPFLSNTDSQNFQQEQVSQHLGFVEVEKEIDSESSTDNLEDQDSEPGMVTTAFKPSKQEIREICTELKQLRINPDPCLGVVKAYWENVQGAMASPRRRHRQGKGGD